AHRLLHPSPHRQPARLAGGLSGGADLSRRLRLSHRPDACALHSLHADHPRPRLGRRDRRGAEGRQRPACGGPPARIALPEHPSRPPRTLGRDHLPAGERAARRFWKWEKVDSSLLLQDASCRAAGDRLTACRIARKGCAMIIAIDGTTSSGKGTLAKRLAKRYGLPHLDTGLLYRAVAALALTKSIDVTDERECALLAEHIDLAEFDERELRGAGVGAAASVVASLGAVRRALFQLQRRFAQREGGAVLEGRDIGTVIAPEAEVKLWVDASVEERARRRFLELSDMGEAVTQEDVLAQLKERDARDASRKDAPMKPAEDAVW